VSAGQNSSDLTVAAVTAANVFDTIGLVGNALDTAMPTAADNIAAAKDIVVDTTAPTIAAISSQTLPGPYNAGKTIDVRVTMSEPVKANSKITVVFKDFGGTLELTAATTGTTLVGSYVVQQGQNTSPLDVIAIQSQTIEDRAGNALVDPTLPTGANALANSGIIVDTTPPVVSGFSSTTLAGAYKAGSLIEINATLTEVVRADGGTITVFLSSGGQATLTATSQGNMLSGTYTVAPGENVESLAVTGFSAGTLLDLAGNPIVSTPLPGTNLPAGIVIDTVAPTLVSITAGVPDGTYKDGDSIPLTATLKEPVVAGSEITVTLNTQPSVTVTLRANAYGDTLTGTYTVAAGHVSSDLDVLSYQITGPVADLAGNVLAQAAVPAPRLATSRNIVVDAAIKLVAGTGFSTSIASFPDRKAAVTVVPITFSSPVSGVTLAALRLFYNGRLVSLKSATLKAVKGSTTQFELRLPTNLTNVKGFYQVQVLPGTGIAATQNGAVISAASSIYWGNGRTSGLMAPAPAPITRRR
jgi:hypothetical protein